MIPLYKPKSKTPDFANSELANLGFYRRFISMCCSVNFENFEARAFNEAFDEFTQLLQLKSEK